MLMRQSFCRVCLGFTRIGAQRPYCQCVCVSIMSPFFFFFLNPNLYSAARTTIPFDCSCLSSPFFVLPSPLLNLFFLITANKSSSFPFSQPLAFPFPPYMFRSSFVL